MADPDAANFDLPVSDLPARSTKLRAALETHEFRQLLVTTPSNIRWLTGFTGSNGVVLVAPVSTVLLTDGRYGDQAPAELAAAGSDASVVIERDLLGAVAGKIGDRPLGIEASHLTWSGHRALTAAGCSDLVASDGIIETLRMVKDDGEVARMRAAAAITDAALAAVAPMLAGRPTERDVARALDDGIRERGATASAYETIVASGPNGALPHARPTTRIIEPGDLIVVDVGAVVDGYRSDMTRTFCVGEPDETQRRQLDVVARAQAAGKALVGPGVGVDDIDAACRAVIDEAGWSAAFNHGTGHGVGLDIHEIPFLNARTNTRLEPGMVVTVEPGVYLPDRGGVRWEDLLVVTESGAETLTRHPKDPIIN